MNRTLIRGVTAVVMSGAVVVGGTVAGTALAASPTTEAAPAAPPPPVVQPLQQVLYPAHATAKIQPRKHHRASRARARVALTGSPQTIAHALLLRHGWSDAQWQCLDELWMRESGWRTEAENRSGAYGIPQALPGYKMAAMGSDWRTNPITQIRWGLWYIANSYGSPCNALAHSNAYNYY